MKANSAQRKRIEKHKQLVQKAIDNSRILFEKTVERVSEIKEYLLTRQDPFNGLRY